MNPITLISSITITRDLNGVTFTTTLTNAEIRTAYEALQHHYDLADIDYELEFPFSFYSYPEEFITAMRNDETFMNAAAKAFRGRYDCTIPEHDQLVDAVEATLEQFYPRWNADNK